MLLSQQIRGKCESVNMRDPQPQEKTQLFLFQWVNLWLNSLPNRDSKRQKTLSRICLCTAYLFMLEEVWLMLAAVEHPSHRTPCRTRMHCRLNLPSWGNLFNMRHPQATTKTAVSKSSAAITQIAPHSWPTARLPSDAWCTGVLLSLYWLLMPQDTWVQCWG